MPIATKQAAHAIADDLLRLPGDFPDIPDEVQTRFASAKDWQDQQQQWWTKTQNSLSEFAGTVQDGIAMGNVLTVDGDAGAIYIRNIRGEGKWADPDTPFYVNRSSYFSLGSALTWNPETKTLMISGTITAIAGTIGGFNIGADYIRDTANSFGLSSTVTGGNDVRFWAGSTFANRNTAPLRFYEDGTGVIAGFTIGAGSLSAGTGATTISISNAAATGITLGDPAAQHVLLRKSIGGTPALFLFNVSNLTAALLQVDVATASGSLSLFDAAGASIISLDASTGGVSATTFSGSGVSLTALNASNIASGTLNNARLPAAISVTSLQTANFFANVGTAAIDAAGANFRVFSDAARTTQTARIDAATGFYYVQGNQVVGARGTRGAAGLTEVVALLDTWQSWA